LSLTLSLSIFGKKLLHQIMPNKEIRSPTPQFDAVPVTAVHSGRPAVLGRYGPGMLLFHAAMLL
jgi:hypothetical protein